MNGKTADKNIVFNEIEKSPRKAFIKTFSDLPYSELINYYLNAKALLIPLRDTLQDIARFPHKIAEYTASKKPIITTNIGEIPVYFIDGANALVIQDFNIDAYSQKMQYVIDYPDESIKIGIKGWETGKKYFNYNSYGKAILKLLVKES